VPGRGGPGALSPQGVDAISAYVLRSAAGTGRSAAAPGTRLPAVALHCAKSQRQALGGRGCGSGSGGQRHRRRLRAGCGEPFGVDLARAREVKAISACTVARCGPLEVRLNNAAVGFSETGRFPMASVGDTPEEAWDAILAINPHGAAMACTHAIPVMVKQGGGGIVNLAATNARVAVPGADAYTAATGGLVALTRVLASDWGPQGIRVTCICPGAVDTPLIRGAAPPERRDAALTRTTPIGRLAQPAAIARCSLFLASSDASCLTGAIIPVDGGGTAR